MRYMTLALALTMAIAMPFQAQAWEEPARGTALRADLMDALRPHAEFAFGAPVVFVVQELRVEGDVAFGMLTPVRPGGSAIGFDDLNPRMREFEDRDFWGGADMQALFEKSGRTWVATHQTYGATDVWWADPMFCTKWHPVILEYCSN
ncbi:hypothetical protein [Pelagimonas varians]|uniref:Uncharacterized protein n=1 Tax=Pelagimonas varians TaxID=696760 RepID=A0A238L3H4_9RHOB|nr:hypothetical protein [Pelagimonas varians]PYG26472.1 hypothetical protein C8N36_12233 [Pelagimonas varians]SMX49624.1 hypothetical protein PEV8663_04257 [Pelagimonas varians]